MYGLGDVRFFDRIALYDRVMPPADGETLAAGLDHATRPIDRLLDIGGGSGRAAPRTPDRSRYHRRRRLARMLARAREHRGLSGVAGDAGGGSVPRRIGRRRNGRRRVSPPARSGGRDRGSDACGGRDRSPGGGALVIREFDPTNPLGRVLVASEHAIGMESRFRSPDDLAAALADAGFDPRVVDRGFGYTVVGVRE